MQDRGHEVVFGKHVRTVEDGTCTWAVEHLNKSCCGNMDCGMPQYIEANSMLPIKPEDAPAALQEAEFPETPKTGPYDVLTHAPKGGCRDSPGPASPKLYCVKSTSPSWVGFKWYRFVDQPGMVQAKLTEEQKDYMQKRIETLHRNTGVKAGWLKARQAAKEGLASIDAAAIVTPPAGMEVGYVPIVLYEGVDKPQGCDEEPPPAPLPPPPPPSPPPICPSTPPPSDCAAACLAAGHCCIGTVSSYGTTSCAQGCIVANYTASVAECQAVCRKCVALWNILVSIYGFGTTHAFVRLFV